VPLYSAIKRRKALEPATADELEEEPNISCNCISTAFEYPKPTRSQKKMHPGLTPHKRPHCAARSSIGCTFISANVRSEPASIESNGEIARNITAGVCRCVLRCLNFVSGSPSPVFGYFLALRDVGSGKNHPTNRTWSLPRPRVDNLKNCIEAAEKISNGYVGELLICKMLQILCLEPRCDFLTFPSIFRGNSVRQSFFLIV
jgi:hypothetical protein